jgi:hypothetical protein
MLLVGTASNMVTGQGMSYGGCTNGGPSLDTKIQLCSSQYFSAVVDVTVTIDQTSTMVNFSVETYKKRRKPVSGDIFDGTSMEDAFFSAGWPGKFGRNDVMLFNDGEEPWYGGPLAAIAVGPNYNTSADKLYNSTSLTFDANGLFQQYFGEVLREIWKQDAIEDDAVYSGISDGVTTTSRSRIVSNKSVGITLATLLLLSALLVLHVALMTRLSLRPLGLKEDPSKIEAAAALLLDDTAWKERLYDLDQMPQKYISSRLDGYVLRMTSGKLELLSQGENVRDSMCEPIPMKWFPLTYAGSRSDITKRSATTW